MSTKRCDRLVFKLNKDVADFYLIQRVHAIHGQRLHEAAMAADAIAAAAAGMEPGAGALSPLGQSVQSPLLSPISGNTGAGGDGSGGGSGGGIVVGGARAVFERAVSRALQLASELGQASSGTEESALAFFASQLLSAVGTLEARGAVECAPFQVPAGAGRRQQRVLSKLDYIKLKERGGRKPIGLRRSLLASGAKLQLPVRFQQTKNLQKRVPKARRSLGQRLAEETGGPARRGRRGGNTQGAPNLNLALHIHGAAAQQGARAYFDVPNQRRVGLGAAAATVAGRLLPDQNQSLLHACRAPSRRCQGHCRGKDP